MNKDSIKIKYLIGSFRDDPQYPSIEDFEYLILNWYFNEGGKDFMEYRRIDENKTTNPVFTGSILTEKLNGDEKLSKKLVETLITEGIIQVLKETRFTQYYEILKTKMPI